MPDPSALPAGLRATLRAAVQELRRRSTPAARSRSGARRRAGRRGPAVHHRSRDRQRRTRRARATTGGLQPAENVTPLVHREVVDRWGTSSTDRRRPASRAAHDRGAPRLNARGGRRARRPAEVAPRLARPRRGCRDRPDDRRRARTPATAAGEPPIGTAARRRRRPTGAPPPLPASIGTQREAVAPPCSSALVIWVAAAAALPRSSGRRPRRHGLARAAGRAAHRQWLTDVIAAGSTGSSPAGRMTVVGVTIVALLVFRRWRHLLRADRRRRRARDPRQILYRLLPAPPYDVTTIGRWSGCSMPSPPGRGARRRARRRRPTRSSCPGARARWPSGSAACWSALFVGARLYLGVDHPSDVLVAVAIGVAIPLLAFRVLHPERGLPGRLPAGQDRPPRRERPPGRGDPPGGAATSSASRCSTSARGPGRVRADRPRSG